MASSCSSFMAFISSFRKTCLDIRSTPSKHELPPGNATLRDPRSTSRRNNPGPSKSTKSTTSSTGAIQSNGKTMIMETLAVNPTAAAGGTADHLMKQPPLALIRPTPTIDTTNFNQIDPHHQQDYSVRDHNSFTFVPHVHSVVHHLFDTSRYLTESVQTVFHFAHMTNHPRHLLPPQSHTAQVALWASQAPSS